MERVFDLYEQPYDADYPVVYLEKLPKQLTEQQEFTAIKAQRRHDSKYVRHGAAELFVATARLARTLRRGRPLRYHVGALCGPAPGHDLPHRQKNMLGDG